MTTSASSLRSEQQDLVGHALVSRLNSLARWRVFMEHHVFCVWDFMSLLKRLQRDHTCLELPWRPPPDAQLSRLVNEMVMEEESDLDALGAPTSHLELYLAAMSEAGADRGPIDRLLGSLPTAKTWCEALQTADASPLVTQFVKQTLDIAIDGKPHEAAAAFFYGREQVLPHMFEKLVTQSRIYPELKTLTYYFERHIELDGGSHSFLAQELVAATLGDHPERQKEADRAAHLSLAARARLWETLTQILDRI